MWHVRDWLFRLFAPADPYLNPNMYIRQVIGNDSITIIQLNKRESGRNCVRMRHQSRWPWKVNKTNSELCQARVIVCQWKCFIERAWLCCCYTWNSVYVCAIRIFMAVPKCSGVFHKNVGMCATLNRILHLFSSTTTVNQMRISSWPGEIFG